MFKFTEFGLFLVLILITNTVFFSLCHLLDFNPSLWLCCFFGFTDGFICSQLSYLITQNK